MSTIYKAFRQIIEQLAGKYAFPPISQVYFPPFFKGGQPKESEFICLQLERGACGISYVLLPDEEMENYETMAHSNMRGIDPIKLTADFGSVDPVQNMVGLAAINAICQHVMKTTQYTIDAKSDSMGLLDIQIGDRVGMVGFFPPLVKRVKNIAAELIVFEQKEQLIDKFPQYNITLDLTLLGGCSKVLCTSTTVYNNTLDSVLEHCHPDAFISVIGPTAGYFPDPLFARGVDVVGGSFINDGDAFMQRLNEQKRWRETVSKFCFQKDRYAGLPV